MYNMIKKISIYEMSPVQSHFLLGLNKCPFSEAALRLFILLPTALWADEQSAL